MRIGVILDWTNPVFAETFDVLAGLFLRRRRRRRNAHSYPVPAPANRVRDSIDVFSSMVPVMVGVRLDGTKELVATMKDVANELRAEAVGPSGDELDWNPLDRDAERAALVALEHRDDRWMRDEPIKCFGRL